MATSRRLRAERCSYNIATSEDRIACCGSPLAGKRPVLTTGQRKPSARASAALAGSCARRSRPDRGAFRARLGAPLGCARRRARTLDLRDRPDQLALADHAIGRLTRALDLIKELARVIRELAHD